MAAFWEETRDALEPLITHPQLTEKNLSRPPFRFIHDIITNINSTHGTFADVNQGEYSDGAAIDSKEKKVMYLEGLIKAVERVLGIQCGVNPKKIVTGSEVEATNLFLRQIADAVRVGMEMEGAPPPPPPPPPGPEEDTVCPPSPPPPPAQDVPHQNRRPKKTNPAVEVFKLKMEKITGEFLQRIGSYGFQTSPEALPPTRMSMDITAMGKDFEEILETEPSRMPEATLAVAIQRQMEAILQVSTMIDENNNICNQLVEQLMSGLQ